MTDEKRPGGESTSASRGGSSQQPLAATSFLTVAEVAALMRVSKMTVYRLVHGGNLPAVRVGRSFRVPESAVRDYLATPYFDEGGPTGAA
jgi:excisionase family DNA binding protein